MFSSVHSSVFFNVPTEVVDTPLELSPQEMRQRAKERFWEEQVQAALTLRFSMSFPPIGKRSREEVRKL